MRWTPALRQLDWLVARPIAHRGYHDVANGIIENTESAFARAVEAGYAIECDLQLTADGEAVVFHDDTLDRVMNATGLVRERTVRQLQALSFRSGKDRIPTLNQMLEQVDGRTPLVIELKTQWDGDDALAARALACLAPYRGPHCLMSFDPDLVEAVKVRSPDTVRGIVADRVTDPYYTKLPFSRRLELRHLDHVGRTDPHFLSYQWDALPFAPAALFRESGRPVITWTIRSREQASHVRRYCDQVTFERFAA